METFAKYSAPELRIEELDQGPGDVQLETPKSASAKAGATPMPNMAMTDLAADAREKLHSLFSTTPVVAFHWIPPWHWSMTNAIARKAFNAFGQRPWGWRTLSTKCLMIGKTAKHSDAVQLNFMAFLEFSVFFAWKSTWTYWHFWCWGYCHTWKYFSKCWCASNRADRKKKMRIKNQVCEAQQLQLANLKSSKVPT